MPRSTFRSGLANQEPVELRNAIFTYCATDNAALAKFQRTFQPAEAKRPAGPWTSIRLAQVNQQIRAELLSILLRGFTHRVKFPDLAPYLQAFITPHIFARGTVQIDICGFWNGDRVTDVDIAPVLRLLPLPAGIVLDVYLPMGTVPRSYWFGYQVLDDTLRTSVFRNDVGELMGIGLSPDRAKKWLAHVARAVKEVHVTLTRDHECRIHVVVKPAATEWWMNWAGAEDGQVPSRVKAELGRWVEATKCPVRWKDGVFVVGGATR